MQGCVVAFLRILIADDHETVRCGLRNLLSLRPEWEICGEAVDGHDAVQKVKELKPRVAVLDISMPQLNGLEATRLIRKEVPETEVLIVSQHVSPAVVAAAMNAGARGYVVKADVPRDFLAAVEAVSQCRSAFSSSVADYPANLFLHSDDPSRNLILPASAADTELDSIGGSGHSALVGVRDRLIFQQSPQPMWVCDASTLQFLDVNEAAIRNYGYSRQEFVGMTIKNIHPGEDVPRLEQALSEARLTGVYSGQWRHRTKNGSFIDVEVTSHQQDFVGKQIWFSVANDITDRKRAEAARLMLAAIVDSSDDAIISKDLNGVITSWNISAQRIFGYDAAEAIGRNIRIIIPPELRDEEPKILQRLRAGERIGHYETTRVTKQGKRVKVSLTISPIKDSDGRVIGASKIARDITERLQIESALRHSENRLRLAQAAANIGTWEWDPVRNVGSLSDDLHRMFGTDSTDQRHPQTWISHVHPEDLPKVQAKMEETRGSDVMEFEYRYQHPERGLRWFYCKGRRFSDGNNDRSMFGVLLDVTERKQLEQELRAAHDELEKRVQERTAELAESNRALEAQIRARTQAQEALERQTGTLREHSQLLDLANDAIFIRSFDGTVSYWNDGAERLYGWTKEEAREKRLGMLLQTKFPTPFEKIKEALVRDGNWEGELVHTRKDGSRVTVASRWTLWRDQDGRPLGWLQINTDISGRRRAEESLRHLSARLLQLQDDERRRIARELHDSAGQILVALDINLSLIEKNAENHSPKTVNAINESLGLVQQLSKELRTISHLLHPPLLDEAGLRSAVQWYVDGFAKRSKIPVDLELASDLGRLPRELETTIFRIVQECLTNIHRHSGSATANIRISRNSDGVAVEIRDRGKGMSNNNSRNSSGPVTPGVGIQGMRERVRQLGGHLKIRSGSGGTTVSAILPVAIASAQSATGAAD